MIQLTISEKSYFKCPELRSLIACTALETVQLHKVAAVALACIVFFGFQAGCSWPLVAGIALFCSMTTLVSEAYLRTNSKQNIDWCNTNLSKTFLIMHVAFRLIIVFAATWVYISLGNSPVQSVAHHIMSGNLRVILLATVVGPIAEEILFRGFVQERLEDLCTFVDRSICHVSEDARKWCSTIVQLIFFGSMHIMGAQVIQTAAKLRVFFATSLLGLLFTYLKHEERSLLAPIAAHAAQNTGFTLGLLLARTD